MGGSGANGLITRNSQTHFLNLISTPPLTLSNQCFNEKSLRFYSIISFFKVKHSEKESLILETEKEEF